MESFQFIDLLALLLVASFGAWATVVKLGMDKLLKEVQSIKQEVTQLIKEAHLDRLEIERRLTNLEAHTHNNSNSLPFD